MDSVRKVLAEQRVRIADQPGFANMVQTLLALERMPDTTGDPLSCEGPLTPVNDKKEKLFVGALLLCGLGHNSPYAEENEPREGVFTNYIQFMDLKWVQNSLLTSPGCGVHTPRRAVSPYFDVIWLLRSP